MRKNCTGLNNCTSCSCDPMGMGACKRVGCVHCGWRRFDRVRLFWRYRIRSTALKIKRRIKYGPRFEEDL